MEFSQELNGKISSIKNGSIMRLIRVRQDENNNYCILKWDDTSFFFFFKSLMHFCKIKKIINRVDILIYLCSFKSIINCWCLQQRVNKWIAQGSTAELKSHFFYSSKNGRQHFLLWPQMGELVLCRLVFLLWSALKQRGLYLVLIFDAIKVKAELFW